MVNVNVKGEMTAGCWRGVLEGIDGGESGNLVAGAADVAAIEDFAGA